jgi:Type IV secretion system pilin
MNILKRNQRSSGFIRSVLLAVFFIIPSIACAQSFTPLTSLPGVADATATPDLAAFLSNLYKLCIGAAAILAVLKIIQGGITYMLGDSITEKKEAKHHISMAVLGLVLVLSPALVFGIIDERILSLDIGKSIAGLATEPGDGSGNQNGVPSPGADTGTDNGGGTPDTSNPDTSTDPDPDNAPVNPPPPPEPSNISTTNITGYKILSGINGGVSGVHIEQVVDGGVTCNQICVEDYVQRSCDPSTALANLPRCSNGDIFRNKTAKLASCVPEGKEISITFNNVCVEKGVVRKWRVDY